MLSFSLKSPRLISDAPCLHDCSKKRSSVFHRLLADFGQSKRSEGRLQDERDAARKISVDQKSAFSDAQSEIARLNAELEKAKSATGDLKTRFVDATKKQKETLDQAEARDHLAETELALLRSKQDAWLTELTGLNRDMNSKYIEFSFSVFLFLPISPHGLSM